MSEKTQFTPEDVGRSFYTEKRGVVAKLIKWDYNSTTHFKCLFEFSDNVTCWCTKEGVFGDRKVFPSCPVKEQHIKLHPAIQHISAEGDFSNETIELLNKLAEAAYKSSIPSQPTIDGEVEELARELYISYSNLTISESFEMAESFIKFRNERRASHGK